jgi:ERCC4-type nuclease
MQAASAPVLYDHRETNSGVPEALAALGIPVRAQQLPAGDYVLSDRLVVERKTGSDLAASIKDRRLFEQVDRLTGAYAAVVLVVEGEPQHISEASWMGALARVLLAGIAIVRTDDPDHTARWLLRLYRVEGKGPSASRGLPRARRPTEDLEGVAQDVLSCVPGISGVGARRLLAHFGSLRAVFAADEAALRGVRGIGPVRARGMAELFAAEPGGARP